MRRLPLALLILVVTLLGAAGAAQAVVVDVNALGSSSVAYNGSDQSGYYGVNLSTTSGSLASAGIPTVATSGSCTDPQLSSDLWFAGQLDQLPGNALCWHAGGSVMHGNETFALTWDPNRRYWQGTKDYVQQFLRNVAAGSGTLSSPYAVTTQYADGQADAKDPANPTGRAENSSIYGGACVDYGNPGGYTCQLGNTTGTGTGSNYPASGQGDCHAAISGQDPFYINPAGLLTTTPNDVCLTDADIRQEVASIVSSTQIDTLHTAGYTPTVMVLTPPGVEVCLDTTGKLCSANSTAPATFCSYHGNANGIAYVVQPWTAAIDEPSACDEPDSPVIGPNPPVDQLAADVGARLVSPLSRSQIGAIVNPGLKGWFGLGGAEIADNNGCTPLGNGLDTVTVGTGSYFLQREFNNTGVIETDPNSLGCTPVVKLVPRFVVPSAVKPGDVVQFDGSATQSTLIVPKANYRWDYGDGQTAIGPSVEHAYAKGGNFVVKLTVTDRGGNSASISQTISVLGQNGQPVTPVVKKPTPNTATPGLHAHLQLLPQGLKGLLRTGVSLRVTSNQPADGLATLSISRREAKRAHLRVGHAPSVVIGRGTVSGVADGTTYLHVRVAHAMASKLAHLRHLTLTVRMTLITATRGHIAIDAAGNY